MFRFLLISLLLLVLASIQNSFSQDEILDSYYVRQTNYINPNFLEGKKGWDFGGRPSYCDKSLTSLPPYSDQLAYLDCTVNNEVDFGTTLAIDTSSVIGSSYTLEVIAQATGTGDPKVGFFKTTTQISDNIIQIVPDGNMRKYAIPMPQDSGYSVEFFGNLIGSLYIKSIRIREDVPSTLAGILNPQTGWEPKGEQTFTASTTSPTKGVTNADEHWCKRDGSDLVVKGVYEQVSTAGSTDGLGAYFLPFPDSCAGTENLEIDTDAIVESGTLNFSGKSIESSGTFYSDSLLISGETSVSIYNAASKQLTLGLIDAVTGESENWGSAKLPMSTGLFAISYSYRVPIKQWRLGTTAITEINYRTREYKYLSSDISSNDADISDLKFTGLKIGQKYLLEIHQKSTRPTNGQDNVSMTATSDGNIICTSILGLISAGSSYETSTTSSCEFIAQSTEVILSAGSISSPSRVDGDGTINETWASLVQVENTMLAHLNQSNIIQDVEQFPLTEQKLCDACAQGEALYKRCCLVSTDITSSGNICDMGTGLSPRNAFHYATANYSLNFAMSVSGGDRALVYYDKSDGYLKAAITGSTYFVGANSYCLKYTKD